MTIFFGLLLAGILIYAGLETARQLRRQKNELTARLRDAELRLAALDEASSRLEARVGSLEGLVSRVSVKAEGDE
jgi:hypothetical protein